MKYKQINKQNIWVEKLSKKNFENSPCLFLDRDGVLIDWKDYTMKTKDAKLIKAVSYTHLTLPTICSV